jgi:1-pyrroline-4-hydroxy-2-carboxylate deaminase
MKHPEWSGIIPAVLTHFNEDFSINFEETLKHIEYLIENGASGIIALGTCGENNSLEADEKIALLEAIVKQVNSRIPVIAGVSELTTKRAVTYTKDAVEAGVDGFMVLPAMAYSSCPRETVAHFKAVADAAPTTPLMVYNCPAAYRVDMDIPILRELAKIDNVVSVKEASGNTRRITDIFNEFGDRYLVLCGLDDTAFEAICLGVKGWISGTVAAFPKEDHAIWTLCQQGRYAEALEIYRWYTPLLHMDAVPKLVQLIKLCCMEVGIGNGICRPPRLDVVGEELEESLKIIRKAISTRPDLSKYGL